MSIQRGLVVPLLTPFDADGSIALDLFASHAHRMLDEGCVGLTPFGTTGEGPSIGIAERMAAVEALIASGIPSELLVVGTGTASLTDTALLTSHAGDAGCAGALIMPGYYFRAATDDGIYQYFETLARLVETPIYLYHIPQVAGIGVSAGLARHLYERIDNVVGIKDSTGDWSNTRQLFEIEGMTVYPGSELPLLEALKLGGPGCISATANINAAAISGVISSWIAGDETQAAERHQGVSALRLTMQNYQVIPAMKHLLARDTGDPRWLTVRPPLTQLPSDDIDRMFEEIETKHHR